MKDITIHPYKGYLNTDFSIHNLNSRTGRLILKRVKTENGDILDECSKECVEFSAEDKFITHRFEQSGMYEISLEESKNEPVCIEVKDAIRFGGSQYKNCFVFEGCTWCFVVMKDRTYFYNRDTKEQYVEDISPDEISFVNKQVVLLKTEHQYTLYSLTAQSPILNMDLVPFLSEKALMVDEVNDKHHKLTLYTFDDVILSKKEIACDLYSIDEERRCLYVVNEDGIDSYSLEDGNKYEGRLDYKNVISFVEGHYVITYKKYLSREVIYINNLVSQKLLGYFESECPIYKVEWKCLFDDLEERLARVDEVFNLAFSKKVLDGIQPMEYKYEEISRINILNERAYFLLDEHSFFIDRFGNKKHKSVTFLKSFDRTVNKELDTSYPTISKHYGRLLVEEKKGYSIWTDGKVESQSTDRVLKSNFATIFLGKDGDDEVIYDFYQGKKRNLLRGSFNKFYFFEYGLIWENKKNLAYLFSSQRNNSLPYEKIVLNHSGVFNDSQEKTLFLGGEKLIFKGVNIFNKRFDFPDYMKAISKYCNYVLSVRGTHIYLNTLRNGRHYEEEEILLDVYDASAYSNVYLSDDGGNILFYDGEGMKLKNLDTESEESFPNLNFIKHINGYRPLFCIDQYRKPRMIDPFTNGWIHEKYLSQYQFVSPDEKLYADSALKDYVKIYGKIEKRYLTNQEYKQLKEKYDYSSTETPNEEKKELRLKLMNEYPDFFKDNHGKIHEEFLLERDDFSMKLIEERGFAKIRSVKTNEVVADIELGPKLWFLNYVTFSFDSRYVIICGKYPDGCAYGKGLLLLYDLKEKKVLQSVQSKLAVWTAAFTKQGYFAAYNSRPVLFTGIVEDDVITETEGNNFLTFSPDGYYMALSNQGYVPYGSGEKSNWGHQKSTRVYVRAIQYPFKDCMPVITDLSDGDIEKTYHPKNVASCSFSKNNRRLMMVGNDGVVIVRNLHLKKE